jgi:hypothetical protein
VRLAQRWRHRIYIIEIGERRFRELSPRIHYALSERPYPPLLLICDLRPGKCVVYNSNRVTVVAFQSTPYLPKPCHMHAGGKNAKMPKIGI